MTTKDVDSNEILKLRQVLNKLEHDFNSCRQELFEKTRSYYHQSIGSYYILEEDIHELLNRCDGIKQEYSKTQAELMDKRKVNTWSFRDDFKFGKGLQQKG